MNLYNNALIHKFEDCYEYVLSKIMFKKGSSVRTEMEIKDTNIDLFTQRGNLPYRKKHDIKSIAGYVQYAGYNYFYLVGHSISAVEMGNSYSSASTGSFSYDGITWSYSFSQVGTLQIVQLNDCFALVSNSWSSHDDSCKKILDYYFMK